MSIQIRHILLCLALAAAAGATRADDPVLVTNGLVTVRKSDLEAELARFPVEQHAEFLSSPSRIAKMVENIVVNKTLAARARARGLDSDPRIRQEIENQADRVLAKYLIEAEEKSVAIPDLKGRAREIYLLDRSKYMSPTVYEAEQILIDTKCRTDDAALAKAKEVRAEILAGKISFADAARKYSDDAGSREKGGRLDPATPDRFLPTIAESLQALKPGDLGAPVGTPFGIHLLRVAKVTPGKVYDFEVVAPGIIETLREKLLKDRREAILDAVRADPAMKIDPDALEAVRTDPKNPAGAKKRPG
jgi:parvulin-like peptidyl-prolyl isomerase